MKPIFFSFGAFHLYSYGLSIALGVLLCLFLMKRRAEKEGFPGGDQVFDVAFAILVWGFLGARLLYVVQNFSYYLANPLKILAVWEGGLIFYGGALAAVLGFWMTSRTLKLSFWKLLDFFAPYGALAHAFGRIGCFLNGCCYGKTCDLPWAVEFPEVAYPVHPAQLYEAVFDLAIFFFLLLRRKKSRFEGETGLLYFLLYGLGRYLIEFLREPTGWVWMSLTSNQWLSVLIITAAFVLFKLRQPKGR